MSGRTSKVEIVLEYPAEWIRLPDDFRTFWTGLMANGTIRANQADWPKSAVILDVQTRPIDQRGGVALTYVVSLEPSDVPKFPTLLKTLEANGFACIGESYGWKRNTNDAHTKFTYIVWGHLLTFSKVDKHQVQHFLSNLALQGRNPNMTENTKGDAYVVCAYNFPRLEPKLDELGKFGRDLISQHYTSLRFRHRDTWHTLIYPTPAEPTTQSQLEQLRAPPTAMIRQGNPTLLPKSGKPRGGTGSSGWYGHS